MICYVKGRFFSSPAHTLVNTTNAEGVMGKGIAKIFRDAAPAMFDEYHDLCKRGDFGIGDLHLYRTPGTWILNFPTKRAWRRPSKIEYIERGLATFVAQYVDLGITSVAFPALGCGNGGLDWETEVKPVMDRFLSPLPIDVLVHLYDEKETETLKEQTATLADRFRKPMSPTSAGELWDAFIGALQSGVPVDVGGWTVQLDEREPSPLLVAERNENFFRMTKEQALARFAGDYCAGVYAAPAGRDNDVDLLHALMIQFGRAVRGPVACGQAGWSTGLIPAIVELRSRETIPPALGEPARAPRQESLFPVPI